MKLIKLLLVLFVSSLTLAAETYNLRVLITDGDKFEKYDMVSEIADTTFSESIKMSGDEGLNPTKKFTLRAIQDVREVREPDVVWKIDAQTGTATVISNTARIPNVDEATEVDLGEGTVNSMRIYFSAIIKQKHEVRLLFAPLSYDNNFIADSDIFFNGVRMLSGQDTRSEYQFNSYRLSYIYHFDRVGRVQYRLGFTGKVRDAFILVGQDGRVSKFDNVGFVPLLHLGVNILITERLNLDLEMEGSWAPVGYAVDLRATLNYNFTKNFSLGVEVGYLDGGSEVDTVDTFASLLFAFARIQYRF